MRRVFLVALMVAALSALVAAQRNYNPATEVTVSGTIEEVLQVTQGRGGSGTHLKLKTTGGLMDIHVGPTRFLENQKFSLSKGDEVTVVGSKVKDAVIARELKKGDAVLVLRDSQGVPKWSRGARPN